MKLGQLIFSFLVCATSVCADTITVTSLSDSGSGTLREALTNAQNGDTIVFSEGLSGTILLQSSLPPVFVANLSISGPTDQSITIDGNSAYSIFSLHNGPTAISYLNLSHGADSDLGAAIFIGKAQSAAISHVVITPATVPFGKSPLYIDANGYVDFIDSSFTSANDSQIYLNVASMNIAASNAAEFIIDGIGGGTVTKNGTPTVVIATPVSATSDYSVQASSGTVVFFGATKGSGIVLAGSEFNGSGNVNKLVSMGTVMPGNGSTIGILNLATDYIAYGGTDVIKLDPSGACDQILANGGDVSLDGSALVILPASGTYTQGTTFTFLKAGGKINGSYTSVSAGGLDIQINYNAQSIEIEVLTTATLGN